MKQLLLIFFTLIAGITHAQTLEKAEFVESPYGFANNPELPLWVREMYGPQPNPEKVRKLFKEYYRTHAFEKNEHTQYYKRWLRASRYITNDSGFVVPKSRIETDAAQNFQLNQQNSGR